MLFGCLRQNTNHSSENLKVIYRKCLMSYTIINYQFNTGELKKVASNSGKSYWDCKLPCIETHIELSSTFVYDQKKMSMSGSSATN